MSSSTQKSSRYHFGPFQLDLAEGVLLRGATRVKLQDLPFGLLVMLVEHSGEVVTRDELRQRLWPENTFVEFDNSLGVAIRKVRDSLNDDAEAPRYVETIPRRGYRFLAPVTVHDAVNPVNSTLAAEHPPVMAATKPRPTGRYWFIAALVLLIVGAAVYEFRPVPPGSSATAEAGTTAHPVHVRRSVAVLGFRNLPGRAEDKWLSSAFSEMLSTELAAGGALRLVSGEDVARAKADLPLADEDTLAVTTLRRLHANPGADVVVLGSYTVLPGDGPRRIRLDIRAQDTAAGETISEEALTGSEENLFELAGQAGVALRQSLGVSSISPEAVTQTRAALPSNEQAARFYAEGRARLWSYDFLVARDLLVKAVAADPSYPLAHSALSQAWWHLSYQKKARAEAEQAVALSNHLSQEEKLLVEGAYRQAILDWPASVQAYRSLFNLFPDSLDYGLLLASAQMHVKPADSVRTLEVLRYLPPPTGNDARIDMVEAQAWINTDFQKSQAAAKRAIEKASAQGSHAIVSRTYGILCQESVAMGVTAEALGVCESALQSGIAAGDREGQALMRTDLAAIHYTMGDLAVSSEMFRQAIREFRETGDEDGFASASSNLAATHLAEGDLVQAKKLLTASISAYQAVEDKEGVALTLNNLGDLSRQSGELDVAATTYQQAKATAEELDDKNAIGYVLSGLGDVFVDRGDLASARKSYEESLSVRTQAGEKQMAAESQIALAALSIEEGKAAEAENVARTCKKQFHQEQQADDELAASRVLIQALLAQGKGEQAKQESQDSEVLAAKSQSRLSRLQFALASARVIVASDHPDLARPKLDQVLKESRTHGFVGVELETQLVLAQLEKKAGRIAAARAQLNSLERNAHTKGFGLIAQKAAAVLG